MNLFVGNLSPETTENDLRKIFSEFGTVNTSRIIKDHVTGESRGFGFVEMEDKYHAMDAIDNLDGTFLQNSIISVKEAKPAGGGGHAGGGRSNDSRKPNSNYGPKKGYNNKRF
jgi:RNA recognition motif-containing protein